jgi:hypothetical protein
VRRKTGKAPIITLAVLLVLAIAASITMAVMYSQEHSAKVSTEHTLTNTQSTLKNTEADRDAIKASLDTARSDISAKDDQLGTCALVVEFSEHLYQAMSHEIDAAGDYLDNNYFSTSADQALTELNSAKSVLSENGYSSYPELFSACKSGGANS